MWENIFKINKNYISITILLIFFEHTYSIANVSFLKIGIKNKFIKVSENQTLYKINTNLINLNISIKDLKNITYIIFRDDSANSVEILTNNSSSQIFFRNCKLQYIYNFLNR